jgi:hypothetical protein
MLLGIAAVVGVLSIGMIGFALKGSSSGGSTTPLIPPNAAPAATTVDLLEGGGATPAPIPTDNPAPIPTLVPAGGGGGGGGAPHVHHDGGVKEPGGKEPGGKEPAPKASGTGGSVPPKPPAAVENFACTQAAVMKKAGNIAAYQQLKKACEAAGGTVPP